MDISHANIKKFYDSELGGVVQNILCSHISGLWGDAHGLRVMGCGYVDPYLYTFARGSERVIAMSPFNKDVQASSNKNRIFVSSEAQMPIESCSVDRILLIHYLEYCDNLQESLREVWRILKSNGRAIIVVPNRMGVWARADLSPFGHGHPFTYSQISSSLRDNLFIQEHHKGALFVPPVPNSPVLMKSANLIEKMGGSIFPFVAGAHIVEVSKQIYASIDSSGGGSSVLAKTKEILTGKGAAVPQGF